MSSAFEFNPDADLRERIFLELFHDIRAREVWTDDKALMRRVDEIVDYIKKGTISDNT